MKRNRRTGLLGTLTLAFALVTTVVSSSAYAQDAPTQYQKSYDLEVENKIQDSLTALEGVPAAQQTYVFHLRRGWLLYLLGRNTEAVTAYERALSITPASIEAQLGLMLPQMALRRWVDVEKAAQAILQRDALNYLATSRLAWAYYNLGRWADAATTYRRVLSVYPSDIEMRSGLGWSLLKQGKGADAAVEFRQILEVAPRHKLARDGLQAVGVPR